MFLDPKNISIDLLKQIIEARLDEIIELSIFDSMSIKNLNPLSVFDYDRNRNYRFVVEEKNRLRMFDNRGSTVKGFRFRTLSKPLMHPLKHIRLGTKDYIVLH